MSRVLLDLTHTSHTRARTGIQRVCRSLHSALAAQGGGVEPICHDPYEGRWRTLRRWVAPVPPPGLRPAELAGGLIVPELFSPRVGRALPALLARTAGPRIAVFHDAIPLRLPELSPPKNVARFPAYLQELLAFDGIAAVSDDSQAALVDYWRWLGAGDPPPVVTLAPGVDAPPPSPYGHTNAPGAPPVVLCIASIEGRKNHLALLDACETLWRRGRRFELRLIGLAQPQTGRDALARIRALQGAGRPLRYDGPADDDSVSAAYRDCAFTVYPSLMEGFGLPVLESLSHGRPCICPAHGPLGASARDGGCLRLERLDAPAIADAVDRLLTDPECLEVLAQAAANRTFRTWPEYARELTAWMGTLARRGAAAASGSGFSVLGSGLGPTNSEP